MNNLLPWFWVDYTEQYRFIWWQKTIFLFFIIKTWFQRISKFCVYLSNHINLTYLFIRVICCLSSTGSKQTKQYLTHIFKCCTTNNKFVVGTIFFNHCHQMQKQLFVYHTWFYKTFRINFLFPLFILFQPTVFFQIRTPYSESV